MLDPHCFISTTLFLTVNHFKQCMYAVVEYMQLFRERLSEKVHTMIPKGMVGGFEFTALQRNLKE